MIKSTASALYQRRQKVILFLGPYDRPQLKLGQLKVPAFWLFCQKHEETVSLRMQGSPLGLERGRLWRTC